MTEPKLFENAEFRLFVRQTSTFAELVKFYTGEYRWETWQDNAREEKRLFKKVFGLITTTAEASELYNSRQYNEDNDEVLFEKMLELAMSHNDLDIIHSHLFTEEKELRRRNYIRRVFDKADQLGYPTSLSEE